MWGDVVLHLFPVFLQGNAGGFTGLWRVRLSRSWLCKLQIAKKRRCLLTHFPLPLSFPPSPFFFCVGLRMPVRLLLLLPPRGACEQVLPRYRPHTRQRTPRLCQVASIRVPPHERPRRIKGRPPGGSRPGDREEEEEGCGLYDHSRRCPPQLCCKLSREV